MIERDAMAESIQQGVGCTKNVRQMYKKCTLACQFATFLVLAVTWHGICCKKNGDGIGRMPTKRKLSGPTETQGEQHVREYDNKQDRKIFREGS